MSDSIVFQRENRWLPRVMREGDGLRLEVAGGADALHNPRTFTVRIEDKHLAVLRADLARHLILSSALGPLCHAAGVRGPLDAAAAVALLDPILLAPPEQVDAFLQHIRWEQGPLVSHGADLDLLARGRVVASLSAATEHTDWARAQEHDANRRRADRGVTLAPLDTAILKYTGQYLHGSTIPRRNPLAVEPALLPDVLGVIAAAERAGAGMSIARDPRRGRTGSDKQDWKRLEAAVDSAVRGAHPQLADDAVRTVSFLICSEAAARARTQPFDADAGSLDRPGGRTLTFTDDAEVAMTWSPGDDRPAAEAFWGFVAERISSRNEVFTLEDDAAGEGIQLHFYASTVARVVSVSHAGGDDAEPQYRVEYALVDDLAHYRALVRGCIAGGFDALTGRAQWMSDPAELEAARRRRDKPESSLTPR